MLLDLVVRFKVMGDFDPAEITKLLGINPSEVYRKGQIVSGTAMHYKTDGWILNSSTDHKASLDDQLASIFERLRASEKLLEKLPDPIQRETSCIIYTSVPRPVIHFSNSVIKQIAAFAGCLEVGVCVIPDEQPKNIIQYS